MLGAGVSFTGSRQGMTFAQRETFAAIIAQLKPALFTHGDCLGADAEAHDIVRELFPACHIQIFPAISSSRAYKQGDTVHPARPPLVRNPYIVDSGAVLIATPHTEHELRRSGTWYTVRYARRRRSAIRLITPTGGIKTEATPEIKRRA